MAQEQDSIAIRIQKMEDSNDKIFAWINAANNQLNKEKSLSVEYIGNAMELAIKLDNARAQGYCYNTMGAIEYGLSRYGEAIDNYEKALTLFEGFESEKGYYNTLKYIGSAYEGDGQHEMAIEYFKKFEALAKLENNKDDEVYAKDAQARIYFAQQDYNQSLQVYDTILNIEQNRNNAAGYIDASNNLGNVYEAIGDSASAFTHFNQSFQLSSEIGDVDGVNTYYSNTDNYFRNRGQIKEQIQVQQQSIDYNFNNGNKEALNLAYNDIAELNIKDNNPGEAIPFLKQNITLSDELGTLEAKEEALELITTAYQQIGDYEQALLSYQRLVGVRDSVQEEKNKQVLLANNLSSQLDEKDKRIELLQNNMQLNETNMQLLQKQRDEEVKRQQTIIYSLIGGMVLLALAAFIVIRINRDKRKANMLLELKSLRTQMNPHFIFNSLNSVNSFISKNDDRSANKYLSQFSRLMRLVLENSKYDFVPLESEANVLELYLSLEHLRFKDKFDYQFNIDEGIDMEGIEIPPMLIQPFIENSIWHGLRYKEVKGNLIVNVKKEGRRLYWIIEDDGIGRKKSAELKTKNQRDGKSTGMRNIEERLKILNQMNKTDMKVKVFDLDESHQSGTRVEISIPYKKVA